MAVRRIDGNDVRGRSVSLWAKDESSARAMRMCGERHAVLRMRDEGVAAGMPAPVCAWVCHPLPRIC